MALSERDTVDLTRAYNRRLKALSEPLGNVLGTTWRNLPGYDRADVATFLDAVTPAVQATAAEAAAAGNAYVATLLEVPATPVEQAALRAALTDLRTPFLRYWARLNDGDDWPDALAAGADAATSMSIPLVTRPARAGSAEAARRSDRVVGWTRVLSGGSCEWCALVATQRYLTQESADFGHNHCDCVPAPITGDTDPGRFINDELYREVDRAGVADRVYQGQQARRFRRSADNAARRRDETLAELAGETDPARRQRLEERARSWDARANADYARAAEQAVNRTEFTKPDGWTGYVDPSGQPIARP